MNCKECEHYEVAEKGNVPSCCHGDEPRAVSVVVTPEWCPMDPKKEVPPPAAEPKPKRAPKGRARKSSER